MELKCPKVLVLLQKKIKIPINIRLTSGKSKIHILISRITSEGRVN